MNYLLWHGANPLARSAAGELPLELVPACTHNDRRGLFSWWAGGQCECCCMDDLQDAACGKKTARTLLARSCITSFWGAGGIGAWIKLSVLCLLSLAGLWGSHTTCERCVMCMVKPVHEIRHLPTCEDRIAQGMDVQWHAACAHI